MVGSGWLLLPQMGEDIMGRVESDIFIYISGGGIGRRRGFSLTDCTLLSALVVCKRHYYKDITEKKERW